MYSIEYYIDSSGNSPFEEWLDGLTDVQAQARVSARLIRLENGNFGDCKPINDGVWELRIDWGPGYRVYYALARDHAVLLCAGGDKRTQSADVKRAIERWRNWQRRR